MLLLKYLLTSIAWGLFAGAVGIVLNNLYKVVQCYRQMRTHIAPENLPVRPQLRWTTAKWAFLGAWLPLILAKGIAVVPSGMGGIRVSQTSGTRPGTLYPGVHWITPMVESVVLYDLRDAAQSPITQVSAGNPNGFCLRRGGPVSAEFFQVSSDARDPYGPEDGLLLIG